MTQLTKLRVGYVSALLAVVAFIVALAEQCGGGH